MACVCQSLDQLDVCVLMGGERYPMKNVKDVGTCLSDSYIHKLESYILLLALTEFNQVV